MFLFEFEWTDQKPRSSFSYRGLFISFIMLRWLLSPSCRQPRAKAKFFAVPAKALEIRSFFHSQGWSYSSGGRSSSCGSRLSRGIRGCSGSESPPFSAGSYGVSYRGSCLTDPSLGPLPPDRISKESSKNWSLQPGARPFAGLHLHHLHSSLNMTLTPHPPLT